MKVNQLYNNLQPFCTINGIDYYDANPSYAHADWKLLSSEYKEKLTIALAKEKKVSKCGRFISIKESEAKNCGTGINSNGELFHYLNLSYDNERVNLSADKSPNGKKYQFVSHRLILSTFKYTDHFRQVHHEPEKSAYKDLNGVEYNHIDKLNWIDTDDHLLVTGKQNSKENKVNRGSLDPQKDKSYNEKFSLLQALIKKQKDFLIQIKVTDLTEEQNHTLQTELLKELNSLN